MSSMDDPDCTVGEVVSVLKSLPNYPTLGENLPDLANNLGVPRGADAINNDKRRRKTELLIEVLKECVAMKGEEATLESLPGALTMTGFEDSAKSLRRSLSRYVREKKVQFEKLPGELQQLLRPPTSFSIVSTVDVGITCRKIQSQVQNCEVHDFGHFLDFISNSNDSREMLHVIKTCGVKEVKQIIKCKRKPAKLVAVVSDEVIAEMREVSEKDSLILDSVTISNDQMLWDELTPAFQNILKEKVENMLDLELESEDLSNNLNGQVLVDCINKKRPKLLKNTVPTPMPNYINRTLLTRGIISPKLFAENPLDHIFTFSGLSRAELSVLIKNMTTDTSSSQIVMKEITSNFICLDHDSHFQKICEITTNSVHWLRVRGNGRISWMKSYGDITLLQKFVEPQSLQRNLKEEGTRNVLYRDLDPEGPVLIAASPGMGKTVLLSKIALSLIGMYPTKEIIFLNMSDLIKQISKIDKHELKLKIIKALKDLVSNNGLGRHYLSAKLNKFDEENKITVELLLDGFDEIEAADSLLGFEIIKIIQTSFKSIRLWVTSRFHLLQKLEVTLSVLGYTICPFTVEKQLNYLTSYWTRQSMDMTRLSTFAARSLARIRSKMCDNDEDATGNPLLCLVIGEVFDGQACIYAQSKSRCSLSTKKQVNFITEVCSLHISKKLEKYMSTTLNPKMNLNELKAMHIKLSFDHLFPEKCPLALANVKVDLDEALKIGMIESPSNSSLLPPIFTVTSIAEYFVADYISSLLLNDQTWNKDLSELLFGNLFAVEPTTVKIYNIFEAIPSFKFLSIIPYFLNHMIGSDTNILRLSLEYPPRKIELQQLIYASVESDSLNLLKLFLELLKTTEVSQLKSIFTKEFIFLAARQSTLDSFKVAVSNFERFFPFDLRSQMMTLRIAVTRGEFSITEFLINEKKLWSILQNANGCRETCTQCLIHNCVAYSYKRSEKVIEQKLQILDLLVKINPSFLEQRDSYGATPLLSCRVHPTLLSKLIKLGANVLAQDDFKNTVLHSTDYLSGEEYHSLIGSVSKENFRELIMTKNKDGNVPLGSIFYHKDPLPETLDAFKMFGADFNHYNKKGYSILAIAVRRCGYKSTLEKLVECGADVYWTKGWERKNLLHYAAKWGNSKAVEFLMKDQGFRGSTRTLNLKTPMDYAKGHHGACEVIRKFSNTL